MQHVLAELVRQRLVDWVAAGDLLGAEPGEDHAVDRQQAVESPVLLGVLLDPAHDRAHLVAGGPPTWGSA